MSDAGDSHHKRTKSAGPLNLLRRKETHDNDDTTSENGSQSAQGPAHGQISTATTAMSHQHTSIGQQSSFRGHSSKLSTAGSMMGRIPSYQSATGTSAPGHKYSLSLSPEKGTTLEQSVRKFRVVEALRNGDTASISKVIRENAEGGPRTSTSSISTQSATLDDTTILHLAIQCAEQPVVEYVLSDGAGSIDVNARDKDGNTPLHIAAIQGRSQVVRLLLAHKEVNDAIANNAGRLPIDLARNPEIFQQLQLSRSLFAENKIRQVQGLIVQGEFQALEQVLEEPRFKTVLDINSTEFVCDPITVQAGGTLLHEAARRRNTKLIQVLLLHGADPFRRDRKGKLPQDVTKDDVTRAMLKKSPAAVAAQRGIQEKAVLGSASQNASSATPGDPVAGREAREMKGYLKKWTNYRKGYQLRWFVLEDGVLSYYKHQDDAGSACRGAINMKIARLHMSAEEKTKFEIIGKSSVKYTLKANHEVEAKRWFWALNNSIQWTKDQAKEEEKRKARGVEMLKQAKAEHSQGSFGEATSENASLAEPRRSSVQLSRIQSTNKSNKTSIGAGTSAAASVIEDDEFADAVTDPDRTPGGREGDDEEDDYGEGSSGGEGPAVNKDAFNITAQSAKLQLDTVSSVNSAMIAEAARNPGLTLSDPKVAQALQTYDAAIRSLSGLIGDLLRISRDRDAYWHDRLDREIDMRRMWEESMAQVAREQEVLEAKVGEAELKRKMTKRILRDAVDAGLVDEARPASRRATQGTTTIATQEEQHADEDVEPKSPAKSISRHETILSQVAQLSDSESEADEEFFDAVDAGEVEVDLMPPSELAGAADKKDDQLVISGGLDISSSFKGYENGIRTRLKMDADDRPKISLWGILKSMIGKDMTRMTLPVSFNEPTSLLYRCGEDMEYADLLDQAADRTDSIERLIYVAAFAASEYASTIGRVAKPFNPLLGETFEYVRPDKNYRFFIEQVSHHPPIGAAWAESPKWTYYGESAVKSKFYGKSFDINPLGTWFLRLRPTSGGKEDFYTWKKVTSSVVGIITGNPVVDNYGPMEIKNWTTGEVCHIEFKPRGWKASSAYLVSGKVTDATGRVRVSIGGKWNSRLYARLTPGYEATVEEPKDGSESAVHRGSITEQNRAFLIWQANERPQGIPFNLTPFVVSFNHIDDQLAPWLPPTDSRLRPDQRAMEEGQYDFAATEKNRLEEGQRARRKEREMQGKEFVPAWFTKARCEITGEEYWKFNGEYWKRREKAGPEGDAAVWEDLEKIF